MDRATRRRIEAELHRQAMQRQVAIDRAVMRRSGPVERARAQAWIAEALARLDRAPTREELDSAAAVLATAPGCRQGRLV